MMALYLISLYLGLLKGFVLGFGVVSILAAGFASSPESMVVMGAVLLGFCMLFLFFLCFLFFLEVLSVFDASVADGFPGGSRATPSGVIATVVSTCGFVVGVPPLLAVEVGANDSLVCFGPVEPVPSSLLTFVCLVFIPPLGEASLPLVLVFFLFNFGALLVIVALVASVRYGA